MSIRRSVLVVGVDAVAVSCVRADDVVPAPRPGRPALPRPIVRGGPEPFVPSSQATYAVDPENSSVLFRNRRPRAGHVWGRFNRVSGTFQWSDEFEDISLALSVDAASIDTNAADRDKILAGPGCFDAKRFPAITFTSTRIRPGGKPGAYEVTGDLVIRGVSRPVTMTLTKTGSGVDPATRAEVTGIETTFTIEPRDFGMDGMTADLADEVTFVVSLEGRKQ